MSLGDSAEDPLHLGKIAARNADALGEALAEPALGSEMLVVGGDEEPIGARVVGEHVVDAPLVAAEPVDGPAERLQPEQRVVDALELEVRLRALQPLHPERAHAVVELGPEIEHFVDLVEVDGVVQNDLVNGVLDEYLAPEPNL